MSWYLKYLNILVFTALIATSSLVPAPLVYAQNSNIENLRTESENARAYADKRRNQAKQWLERAESARKYAKESHHKRDREGWLADAHDDERNAELAAIDADKAEAKAAKAEAELLQALKKLDRGPSKSSATSPSPEKQTENAPPVIALEELIGVWGIDDNNDDKDRIFVIVQEEPDSPIHGYKLEAHTEERVWKGTYTPFEKGHVSRMQNARVVFKYTPKAKEMNPDIPEWARKKVEGQLEWEIELNEPYTCGGNPTLGGEFFPGKVKWNKENKTVKIDGRGEPRDMTLALQFIGPEEAYVTTAISIRPPDPAGKRNDKKDKKTGKLLPFEPLQVLVEGQVFHVDISLPYEVAKEQGEKLTIKLRGLSGGESEEVELLRGGFRKGRPAKYTNYRPLFFGDNKPFLSQRWQDEIGDHAQRIDLDLENGESVAIGFDRTFEAVPVYKSIEEYTIAKYMEAANFLQNWHRERLVMPGAPKEDKEDAHVRLRRLKNFQIIMNNPDNPKWLRVLVAKEYLGPAEEASQVMYNPEKIYGAGQVRVSNVNIQAFTKTSDGRVLSFGDVSSNELNEWQRNGDNDRQGRFNGVIWSNNYERLRVTKIVGDAWRQRARKSLDTFMVDLTFGFYEWFLSETSIGYKRFNIGVADFFALTSGQDHYGRKLSKGKKIDIIMNVMLSNLTDYAGDELRDNMIDGISGYQAPGDKLLTIKDVVQAVRGRNVQKHKVKLTAPPGSQKKQNRKGRGHKKPNLPASLGDKKIKLVAPTLAANDDTNTSKPISCPAPPRAGPPPHPGPLNMPVRDTSDINTVAKRYGPNADGAQPIKKGARKQEFGTCQAEALLHAAEVDMNPVAVLRLLAENSEEFARKLKNVSREEHPLIYGFTEGEMELLAGLLGRKVKSLPNGKKTSLHVLKGLKENGWDIKIAVHAKDVGETNNLHAVDLVDIRQSEKGCGLEVTVYDSDLRRNVPMPAEDFKKILAEWPVMLHREQVPPKKLSRSDDGASSPPRARRVDEFDDLHRKPTITADEFNPLSGITINEAMEYLYPGGARAPRINIVPRSVHDGLLKGKVWEQPKGGGASFSKPDFGSMRAEGDNIAIRIKEGSEQHIRWESYPEGGGEVPNYTPPDGKWAGQERSYIDPKHLQYMDTSEESPEWTDYRPAGEQ